MATFKVTKGTPVAGTNSALVPIKQVADEESSASIRRKKMEADENATAVEKSAERSSTRNTAGSMRAKRDDVPKRQGSNDTPKRQGSRTPQNESSAPRMQALKE